MEATRIINIYNQKQLGEHPSIIYTSNHIENLQWDPNVPTIITGDWNIQHPRWDSGVSAACPRTCETLEWLDGNGFTLCNEPFIPTREDTMGHLSNRPNLQEPSSQQRKHNQENLCRHQHQSTI